MNIRCPHCQARLNLPGYVEGKQVRCAICRQVFCADQDALKERIHAGSPELASVTPKPRDEERPRAKTRRFEDEDDHDDHLGARDFSPDRQELIDNAKSLARPPAYAMLAAFILSTARSIGYVGIIVATENFGSSLPLPCVKIPA